MNLATIKKFLIEKYNINHLTAKISRILCRNRLSRKGANNNIKFGNTYLKHCLISIKGNNNQIDFCSNNCGTTYFENCKFYINGSNNQIVFDNMVVAYNATFVIEENNNQIKIGNKTLFAGEIELACTESCKIIIGKHCLFSAGVDIRTGDSHSIIDMDGNRINFGKDIVIHDMVWVGRKAMILKGSEIQSHSIIGAASVVTTKFEKEHVAIAGVPAHVIKEGIDWKHER